MKLKLPLDKTLGDPAKLRLFQVDYLRIQEIAEATMHSDTVVTRLALHIGLPLVAKQLGVKLPIQKAAANGNGNGNGNGETPQEGV